MSAAGLAVSIDAAGNIRGLRTNPGQPRLLIASHLDTVIDAGAFDGILGVMLGIAMAEENPAAALEVIGFSEEESIRFGFPFIGSRAVTGTLDDATLNRTDAQGITAAQAIRNFGLDPAAIPAARLSPDVSAYLEFHIEQGPVLEQRNQPLAVVSEITGITRLRVTFEGAANHAGTTPMTTRRDALTCAAEWALDLERMASREEHLVATVGSFQVSPGAVNIIPGRIDATLDLRHPHDHQRRQAVTTSLKYLDILGERRRISIRHEVMMDQPSVAMDATLRARLRAAAFDAPEIPSGAFHDAMLFAPLVPTAMLFLRTPGGISHNPAETVLEEDVELAIQAGNRFLAG
jgi:allantoate deiminase